MADWRRDHPEKTKAYKAARRALEKGALGSHTADDIALLMLQQNGFCACGCGVSLDVRGFEVDHMIPLSRGGPNTPDNLQLLTVRCNRSKNDKTMEEWIAFRAALTQ
jgi:5-methylcytosine-specific restriction endonuclease McrA